MTASRRIQLRVPQGASTEARNLTHAADCSVAVGLKHRSDLDTFTDSLLHSCRRDGAHSGRMVSLVWLAP